MINNSKIILSLLGMLALGTGISHGGTVLLDYSDGGTDGLNDVVVNDGGFTAGNTGGGGVTATFSVMTNWTNLGGSQNVVGFREDFDILGNNNPQGSTAATFLGSTAAVFGQDLAYTIQTGDSFRGAFKLRHNAAIDPGDVFTLELFYSDNNTLTGNATVFYSKSVGASAISGSAFSSGATDVAYTTPPVNASAVGKKLMYSFRYTSANATASVFTDNHYLAVENISVPVTSYRIDVGDDPENAYSGAPQFNRSFFGSQTRIITKYPANYLNHRNSLGVYYSFYELLSETFGYPPSSTIASVIAAPPIIPVIQFAQIGKINRNSTDGERAIAYDPATVNGFVSHYPNVINGGGQTAEVDGDFIWLYSQYYGRLPVGPGDQAFPFAYLDFTESNLKRSGVPYLMQQDNMGWGTHYVSKERALSLGGPQLFYRGTANIVNNLITARSAARQYPHPLAVQFSGQPNLLVSNANDVLNNGATPVYTIADSSYGPNYGKSYALNRQALYLSWLNGASSFNWETGEFINSVAAGFPSPLGTFTKKASDIISAFGPTGPVQTPIAIISEFYNTWQPPAILNNGGINFLIAGDVPYATGDYQLHGLRDFFFPHYLQCETIYLTSLGEDFALSPSPYGNSVDYLLSDVRPEALQRYGLLIWGGVPPEAPAMVREKLLGHIAENHGRVVLFGEAARSMFPEWFANSPATLVAAGNPITYGSQTFSESSDFLLEHLRGGLDASALSLKILATVNGNPLIIECYGGLVVVLSDYGMNHTQFIAPTAAHWYANQLVTEIPFQLLDHARKLLDTEASRQTLFSVGNTNLHYLVTRPQTGQYVIGIFNDKLTSEPFSITSAIGPITNLAEVLLNDNQAELKTAADGAAYAPPGMRNSPNLPLDYGLSDTNHIEGRDFRLFRVGVAEQGTREIQTIQFPSRPAGRVLAVAGLENIRHYLQGISSFFQWFDGIMVTANDLVSMDDGWVAEQAHWLDRRGVRVVADGDGIDEPTALLAIQKLALIHGGRKHLIYSSPSAAVQSAAASAGVTLLDPAAVNRVYLKGQTFNPAATLNVVDRYYKTEDDLFCDLQNFETGAAVAELRGKLNPADLNAPVAVIQVVSNDFLYVGSDITSLTDLLEHDPAQFSKFRGVKVDSTYLLSKTTNALAADAATLTQLGLEVIVDLRRDEMHFDGIAFYPHIPNYSAGTNLFSQIIAKMQALGSTNLILRLQDVGAMRNDATYIAQRDATWNWFADVAQARSVNLHLIFDPGLTFSSTSGFSKPNVFVIQGSKGKASPFRLVDGTNTTGAGSIIIHDEDRGLYATGWFDAAAPAQSSFIQWAAGYGITGETSDADGDGMKNLMEFALGGNPTNAMSKGCAPALITSPSGTNYYVYPRRKNAALTYLVQTSTNLLSWDHNHYVEYPVTGVIDGEFEAVTNAIVNQAGQCFVRLMVEEDWSRP